MKRLLNLVGAHDWEEWIATDIENWRSHRDTSHHLSAYGGAGSFNDFVIQPTEDCVNESNEAWANTLFYWLQSICHFLAHRPKDSFTANSLRDHVKAFKGSWSGTGTLQGWRCLECGEAEVSRGSIEFLLAEEFILPVLFESSEKRELGFLVDRALGVDFQGVEELRRTILHATAACGARIKSEPTWNWKCPYCQSIETSVCRWDLVKENGIRLVLTEEDN